MRSANKFYKLRLKNSPYENEFDINELDEKSYRGISTEFYYSDGSHKGGEIHFSITTNKDYDKEFYKKITKIEPIYYTPDFLDYHYQNFLLLNSEKELFLKHIQYIILPKLEKSHHKTCYELTNEWINKTKKMNLLEQEQENIIFLKKTYEVAIEHCPSNPLSLSINPLVLGESIGFDKTKVIRIMNELFQKKHIFSTLQMQNLFITQTGIDFLRDIEKSVNINESGSINFSNVSASQILIQKDNVCSSQSFIVNDYKIDDLKKLVLEIENNFVEISNNLSAELKDEFEAEIQYLSKITKMQNPKQDKLSNSVNTIKTILKAVPSNIIANILSIPIQSILFG